MKHVGIMIAKSGDMTILSLSGWVVRGDGSELLREALARATSNGTRRVVVDLAGVVKIDAAGLGMLAYYHGVHEWDGVHQELINASQEVELMLRVTGLTDLQRGRKVCVAVEEAE